MSEQELVDLAQRAAQHLYEAGLPAGDRQMGEKEWRAAWGRALVLVVRDALVEHEQRYLHLRGN